MSRKGHACVPADRRGEFKKSLSNAVKPPKVSPGDALARVPGVRWAEVKKVSEEVALMFNSARSRTVSTGFERALRSVVSARYRREVRMAGDVLASVPSADLDRIRNKYQSVAPGRPDSYISHANTVKYLDARHWLQDAAQRALAIGLDHGQGLRVLDLGCGAGYFLAMARHLGHDILGLDLLDNEMYNDFMGLFGIHRLDHCIVPYESLPELGAPLDLITGFMIWFNWSGRTDSWGVEEWVFFLDDCKTRLNPGGRIWLELNPGRNKDRYLFLTDETAAGLREYPGARVAQDKSLVTVTMT